MNEISIVFLIAVRNIIIDSAPIKPSERARLDPITIMTTVTIIVINKRENLFVSRKQLQSYFSYE